MTGEVSSSHEVSINQANHRMGRSTADFSSNVSPEVAITDPSTFRLLKHLGRGAKHGYFWQVVDGKKVTTWYQVDSIPSPPTDREGHLYFGVHGTTAIPNRIQTQTGKKRDPQTTRALISDIAVVNCLFAEYDAKDYGGNKDAVVARIEKVQLPPSVLIDSGGGYHCYWLLDKPEIVTDQNRKKIKQLQRRWVDFVNGDPASKDLARVLRLPGSVNRKYDPPRLVSIVRADFQALYSLAQLEDCLPSALIRAIVRDLGIPVTVRTFSYKETCRYWLNRAHEQIGLQGSQNAAAVWLACQLRDAGMDQLQSESVVWQFLSSLPQLRPDDPWKIEDAKRITASIFTRMPRDPARGSDFQPAIEKAREMSIPQLDEEGGEQDCKSTSAGPDTDGKDALSCLAPKLPESTMLDLEMAKTAGHWLDVYTNYAMQVSPMTPRSFHESAALYMASVVIARRIVLPMAYGEVYPNLFVAWLAQTTLYKKTTGLNIPRRILLRDFPQLLTPQDFTTESFISDLAGQEPFNLESASSAEQEAWRKERDFAAQRGLVLDEFSGLLAGAGKDYNGGLLEAILHFSDCDPLYVRSTRSQGRVAVRNSYLSFLGASTPAAVGRHFTQERLWSMGWWPRFIILTPDGRPEWKEPVQAPEPVEISLTLRQLFARLPASQWPEAHPVLKATIAPEVSQSWQKYNRACQEELLTDNLNGLLWGAYGRLPTQALKTALIFSSLEWPEDQPAPNVEQRHIARALVFAESWRESLHRALEQTAGNEQNRITERLLRIISQPGPNGISFRDITRAMRDKTPVELATHLEQMVRAQQVEKFIRKPQASGRPAECYRLLA